MLNNLHILDGRQISFKLTDGLFEVYDQYDKLVGDAQLQIKTSEDMTVEEIYEEASRSGYNIADIINNILTEAVMVERIYDMWIHDDGFIFFSPSVNDFIVEPFEGVFEKMLENFDEITYQEDSEEGILSEDDENPEEDEDPETDPVQDLVQDSVQDPETEQDPEQEFKEGEFTEIEEPSYEVIEEESEIVEVPVVLNDSDFSEPIVEVLDDSGFNEPIVEVLNVAVHQPVVAEQPVEQNPISISFEVKEEEEPVQEPNDQKEQVNLWKEAYVSSLRNTKEVNGVRLSSLRDKVISIILEKDVDVFQVDEKDVIFELIDSMPTVFDTKMALESALYQVYLIQQH